MMVNSDFLLWFTLIFNKNVGNAVGNYYRQIKKDLGKSPKSLILLAGTIPIESGRPSRHTWRDVLTNNQDDHLRERSNQKNGGDDPVRSDGKPATFPSCLTGRSNQWLNDRITESAFWSMTGTTGLEPATSGVTGRNRKPSKSGKILQNLVITESYLI